MAICDTDVVILAAGNGLRLSSLSPLPKPLVTVAGRPLLDRVLEAVRHAQLHRVKIVIGHQANSIRHHHFPSAVGLDIEWIENQRYSQPNGISLLCAEGHARPPFVLLMADHLFEAGTLRRLLQQPCPPDGAVLAVDLKLDLVYDLPDATKVVTRGSALLEIGKSLPAYDAIDTGMFLCTRAVFSAMKDSAARGRQSLTDGIATLGRAGRVRTWDVGPAAWIDVDTPGAREEAERLVRAGCFEATRAPAPRYAGQPRPGESSASRRTAGDQRHSLLAPCEDVDLVGEPG